ncbi:MAG TPA: efflux RND transporter permease subunit [Kiritimatiellia bacterium]|nr:efflux RND transporter permease subunit [Kiritimatiellia bacterium]HMO99766.1 efflux RND transporter permease subunit [Kiritimatiellia bacterium]
MSMAAFCLERKVLTYALALALLLGGLQAYRNIGRLEDPEFTIKNAQIITTYPGASAAEVMNEITDPIEFAVQQMGQLKKVTSVSYPGRSVVTVEMQDQFGPRDLPQIWDELRRKVRDMQGRLPPGAGEPVIADDFGDVYGVFYAIYGDGYSYADLRNYAKLLRRELLLCDDVAKITLVGEQPEVVYLEIGRTRLANTGISIPQLQQVISGQNLAADAGYLEVSEKMIRIFPTGKLASVDELGELLLVQPGAGGQPAVRLRDIATIRRDYLDPPRALMRYNGHPCIGVGISTVKGGNVITMGASLDRRIAELKAETPIGIEFGVISHQADSVNLAVRGFVVNLIEAVVIVIAVLLVAMGMQSGLLIGAVLVVTVMGTVLIMQNMGLLFERISLGAFIIALGMLVDNAIVITEGVLIAAQKGQDKFKAALATVKQTQWPLLGATVIAILSFAPIGASQDSTGEYCRSLFLVLLISLLLSWVLAITLTPLMAAQFLKGKPDGSEDKDPYAGRFFTRYRAFLVACIRHRWVSVAVLVALLGASGYAFGFVKQSFFPESTRPQFMVHIWMPAGSSIRASDERVARLGAIVRDLPGVRAVTEMTGTGGLRFMLTYTPETPDPSYGLLLVDVEDATMIDSLAGIITRRAIEETPDAMVYAQKFSLGPGDPQKIQVRISGPDVQTLRRFADRAIARLQDDPRLVEIQADWRNRVDVLQPVVSEARARTLGVTRRDIAAALTSVTVGMPIAAYKEGDDSLPVLLRSPPQETTDPDSLYSAWFWSVPLNRPIPLAQVIDRFEHASEEAKLHRRDRLLTITVKCNTTGETAATAFRRIYPDIMAIMDELPEGYRMEWGGEYESSRNAQAGLVAKMPPIFALMVLIVLGLFNSVRRPLVIFLTVPLTAIGVTAGLLAFNQPFGFMALLGFLSLAGMQIKNAIVLIDEINAQQAAGVDPFNAIINAGVTRLRPVVLAALTTVLGMLPLLLDAFYVSMAVTIMCGLAFATVLTMVVIPLNYAIIYRIKAP